MLSTTRRTSTYSTLFSSTYEVPTLLVWGARDTLIPLRVAEALTKRLRGVRLVLIPAAGHNPMWGPPAAFNHAVLTVLRAAA